MKMRLKMEWGLWRGLLFLSDEWGISKCRSGFKVANLGDGCSQVKTNLLKVGNLSTI
jgi:hypothetical protein